MVATRNDGHPKKSEAPMLSDIRCASRSIERLARTHACGDRVAKKWRAGGGGAEKIRAAVRAFTYSPHLFPLPNPSFPFHSFSFPPPPITHHNSPPRHPY